MFRYTEVIHLLGRPSCITDNTLPFQSDFDSTTIGYSKQDIVIAIHALALPACDAALSLPRPGHTKWWQFASPRPRGCCSRLPSVPWIYLVHKRIWVAKTFQTGFGPLQLVRSQYCQVATEFLLRFSITAILKDPPILFFIPPRESIRFPLQPDAAAQYLIYRCTPGLSLTNYPVSFV